MVTFRTIAAGALVLASLGAGGTVYAEPVASQASAPTASVTSEIDALLADPDSVLGTLVAHVPDLRTPIETRLRAAGESDGIMAMRDEAFRAGWEYGQRYMARFADAADGPALLSFLAALDRVVIKMHDADPVSCFDWMFGAEPLDLDKAGITVADVNALNDGIVAVIRTGAAAKPVPPGANVGALIQEVTTRAATKTKGYESGWTAMADPHAVTNDHDKAGVCKAVKALYGEILALPMDDAVAVSRMLFAKESPVH
jgi:hypothetical protein